MKHKSFPVLEDGYDYFYKQAAKNPSYIGLLKNTLTGWFEVLFVPPVKENYFVIKLNGII